MPIDVGLILHLTFDDPADLSADELGHEVVCESGCGQQTDDANNDNEAITLAGSCLSVTPAPDLEPTTLSLALWVRQSTPPSMGETLIARTNDVAAAAFVISGDMANLSFSVADVTASNPPLIDSQWHHFGIVFNDSAMALFVDGVLAPAGPVPQTEPSYPVNEPITIGCQTKAGGTARHFHGDLDDVRIYNRVLTEAEVKILATP